MKIAVFGSGYVGLTTGACLANLGHTVICVDIDAERIRLLSTEAKIPFHEPGLEDLVRKNVEKKRLTFTTNGESAIDFATVIFNCVGTPQHANGAADLQYVWAVAEQVGVHSKGYKIMVNKSTVPPGTAKKAQEIILKANPQSEVEVLSNPEFLKEGAAIHDFNHPDKIVIGALSERARTLLRKVYLARARTYIPLVETNWETAEMIKYANNAFLATKISFINEIANICDYVNADVETVAQAMGMDYRISPKFLHAGVGYGGSCFPKDVRALISVGHEIGYDAELLRQVDELNERQKRRIVKKLEELFPASSPSSASDGLAGRTLALLGLSFKPKTSDMREAPSLIIVSELLARGVGKLQVYDPIAMEEAMGLLAKQFDAATLERVVLCKGIAEAATGAEALLLITEWDEFRSLDFAMLKTVLKRRLLIDGRNIYDPEAVREEGFEYHGIGRRSFHLRA